MLSDTNQLFLELLNRARLDPLGEAERYREGFVQELEAAGRTADAEFARNASPLDLLNLDLRSGFIDGTVSQVLAPNALLADAALGHTRWMLANDLFQHVQPLDLTSGRVVEVDGRPGFGAVDRMVVAGVDLETPWSSGENLSIYGSTGTIDSAALIPTHHENLFLSPTHRPNILKAVYSETGIGEAQGGFPLDGVRDYNSTALTNKFLANGTGETFIVGVVYDDGDGDDFYSIGEGRGGVGFSVSGAGSAVTSDAGGYVLAVANAGSAVPVTISDTGWQGVVEVDMGAGNAKLDVVGQREVASSADLTLVSGVESATLLGVASLSLTGGDGHETLTGNDGDNRMDGGAGRDLMRAGSGDDRLDGGAWSDRIFGGSGADTMSGGAGSDKMGGGGGADEMSGGRGRDKMWGGGGNDVMDGGGWQDRMFGHGGFDRMQGGAGKDLLVGGAKRDRLFGGNQDDELRGQNGRDIMFGGKGADVLSGGRGNDRMKGGAQADILNGGGGGDLLNGQRGADVLTGGGGADSFVFAGRFWQDVITDFESGVDTVVMHGGNGEAGDYDTFMANTTVVDGSLVYNMHGDAQNQITFQDVVDLSAGDLDFV